MKPILLFVPLLLLLGCQPAYISRETRGCSSVEQILLNQSECDGQEVSIVGYLTFTRHGIFISDAEDSEGVIAARISKSIDHWEGSRKLIARVRSLPPATSRTLFGRFRGVLVSIPGDKLELEVFSDTELSETSR